ncbi:succinate-semialdehyde dehydrogenase [NADP+] GabD [Tribonema minus]|uniref:Succinate-semialdehyde dehydrogenase [NADP+] GabD n=1 Tax=Tribonema minus TaxID=303371 RepID=A0A835ZAJ4_9STRA|nr:succinate-semialdehyde dehydrogenase [NADP+] GabD [Tribonema minus]
MSISGLKDSALSRDKAYVNGQWVAAESGKTFEISNPATGEMLTSVPTMAASDVNEAIAAAKAALPEWRDGSYKKREGALHKWAGLMRSNMEDLARIMTLESGKPLAESRGEVAYALSFLDFFAEETKRVNGAVIPPPTPSQRLLVIKQAIGVCSLLTPWNFPAAMITRKAAPALAAGCTVVIKPAEDTPLTALALAALAEQAGFPPGVINIVTTPRAEVASVGEAMCTHPDVAKVSFTGSTAVGKILLTHAAKGVKKVSMELGGNAPFIVFDDADLDKAADGLMASKFRFGGQTCVCTNRVMVQSGVMEAFTEKVRARVEALKVGDPLVSGTNLGPLINAAAVTKVRGMVKDALSKGAQALVGGDQGEDGEPGSCFVKPVLLGNCDMSMSVCSQEIFGPVVPLMSFETEDEAVRIANDVPGGLAGYFYSQNVGRIFRVAERLEVGMVGVNETVISKETIPFGGVKEAGLGREGSVYGMDDFMELKHICLGI